MGQIFVDFSKDQLESKLNALKCSLDAEIRDLQSQHDAIKSQMQQLKMDLYGKFGNSINLEPAEED